MRSERGKEIDRTRAVAGVNRFLSILLLDFTFMVALGIFWKILGIKILLRVLILEVTKVQPFLAT